MRFMHISDIHLGVEPDAGKSWSGKRAQDIWDSFREVVLKAGEESVDFLLISGDLFHRQPLKRELKEVNYLFAQIPKVKVVLMAGNHDHMQPKSYYLDYEWAENVFFFGREELEHFDFSEENVTIYGMSYWHKEISRKVYDDIRVENVDRINLLLAHGGDEKHIPFSAKQILGQGMDYIAAGHIHKASQLVEGRAVMAGSLEPTDCNDIGAHGYWMGELEKNVARVDFFPIKKCEYRHEIIQVTPETTQYELEEQIRKLVAEGESYRLYRIFLEGYMEPDSSYDLARLEMLPQIVDVISRLEMNIDYHKILEEQADSLLGRYVKRMQRQEPGAVNKKALEYGVKALLGYDL